MSWFYMVIEAADWLSAISRLLKLRDESDLQSPTKVLYHQKP